MERMDNMNIKSPREWRDKLTHFRIRRRIINRDSSIDEYHKEAVYNSI